MVALVYNSATLPKHPLRVRAQNHTYRLGAVRCSKSNSQAYLRVARYAECNRLESCSKDPIGRVDGPNLYRAYFAPQYVDPQGLRWIWPPGLACSTCTCAVTVGPESPFALNNPGPQQLPIWYWDYWEADFSSPVPVPQYKSVPPWIYGGVPCDYSSTVPITIRCTGGCVCGTGKSGPITSYSFNAVHSYGIRFNPFPNFVGYGSPLARNVSCPAAPPNRFIESVSVDEIVITTGTGTYGLSAAIPSTTTITSNSHIVACAGRNRDIVHALAKRGQIFSML